MKKLTKKQWGLIVVIILMCGGGTYAYAQNQSSVKVEEAKEKLNVSSDKLVKLTSEIKALLDEKDQKYLVKDVNKTQIETLQKKVKKETVRPSDIELPKDLYTTFNKESKKAQEVMGNVTLAYDTQTAINTLYEKTDKTQAMNGSIITKDLPISDDLKKESVEKIKKSYYEEGATSSYNKTINNLINGAEDQLTTLGKAKEAVLKVYKDSKIISTDLKLYDSAKAEVNKIKNEKAKKELSDQLAKVKVDIDKKTTAEASKTDTKTEANVTSDASQQTNDGVNASNQETNGATTNGTNADTDYTPSYDGVQADYGNNGGGYTPPATEDSPSPSQPTTGGGGRGEMDQDDLNQAEKDAADSDWSGFFK